MMLHVLKKSPHALITSAMLISVVSLALFAGFLALGAYDWVDLEMGLWQGMAWNTALSCCFFLQHSGMIRRSFRRFSGRIVPARFQPAAYAMASGLALLLVVLLWQASEVVIITFRGVFRWLLHGVFMAAAAGFLLALRSLGTLDFFGTAAFREGLTEETTVAQNLVIRGPYRRVRHPLYSLTLVMIWTCPVITADRLLFNFLWTGWIVAATHLEERDLIAQFGDDYRAYQRHIPMLVPRLGRWFRNS